MQVDDSNMSNGPDISDVEVIALNFKRRLSGVTATITQLVPVQNRLGQKIATLGPGLPETLPKLRWRDLLSLWTPPPSREARIWHARRNIEMLPGIILRDLFRMKLKLVFTSASQRHHTRWTKFLISQMDAVVATSAKTASYLEVPCTIIMHGIDIERFAPPTDKMAAKTEVGLDCNRKYVGCFGRIRHQKGTDLFVDAMIDLLPKHADWCAIIAGRATSRHTDYERGLKAKVRVAGLENRILFVGEHENINLWYRALDLYVAPQRWEGFGLTPLEAMATGVPVVATDVGVFSELVATGETGVVVPVRSHKELTTAIETVLVNPEMALSMEKAARIRAEDLFSIQEEAIALARLYDSFLCPPKIL